MSSLRRVAGALRSLIPHRRMHVSAPWFSHDTTSAQTFGPAADLKVATTAREWKTSGTLKNDRLKIPSEREQDSMVGLYWSDRSQATAAGVDSAFLRDACRCPICVDPHSGQKNFWTTQLPKFPKVKEVVKTEEGNLRVTWADDFLTKTDHVSEYTGQQVIGWLKRPPKKQWSGTEMPPQYWSADMMNKLAPSYSYEEFIQGEDMSETLLASLDMLRLYGLFFLKDVPNDETAVEKIASKLGRIQDTFYGRTWDVKSKPQAENVAYTSTFLGLHQDLCYMQATPKLQILHCLENTTSGGEALFSDGARASAQLKLLNPEAWQALQRTDVVYRYDKGGHLYENARPLVNYGFRNICWSPPFQRPDQLNPKGHKAARSYQEWLDAAKTLQELMEHKDYVYECRYSPGDCVVFDNTRLLHGRKQFDDTTGARWLKGAYVDHDSYMSTLLKAQRLKDAQGFESHPREAAEAFNQTWTGSKGPNLKKRIASRHRSSRVGQSAGSKGSVLNEKITSSHPSSTVGQSLESKYEKSIRHKTWSSERGVSWRTTKDWGLPSMELWRDTAGTR